MSPRQGFDKLQRTKCACRKKEEKTSEDIDSLTLEKSHQRGRGISDRLRLLSTESMGKFSLKCVDVLFFFFFHRKSALSTDIQFMLRPQYNVRRAHVLEKTLSLCSFIY